MAPNSILTSSSLNGSSSVLTLLEVFSAIFVKSLSKVIKSDNFLYVVVHFVGRLTFRLSATVQLSWQPKCLQAKRQESGFVWVLTGRERGPAGK